MINPYDPTQFPPYPQRTIEERISALERGIKELNKKLDVIKNAKG